jgi:purine-binding chemotaxis protein CheW
MAPNLPSDPASASSIVMFSLQGLRFGLPVDDVREVVPLAWLDRPPHQSSLVEGILNLGGQAVSVLRLDRLLGLEAGHYGLDASILVMRPRPGEAVFGLLVEHVDGVRETGEFTAMGLPAGQSFNDCLAEVLERDGSTLTLLAWGRVLLVQERERLSEFQARAQARLAVLSDCGS